MARLDRGGLPPPGTRFCNHETRPDNPPGSAGGRLAGIRSGGVHPAMQDNCRTPVVYGGGMADVMDVHCLDRPCGEIRAAFVVLDDRGRNL